MGQEDGDWPAAEILADLAPIGLVRLDAGLVVRRANGTGAALLGPADGPVGQPWEALLPPAAGRSAALAELLAGDTAAWRETDLMPAGSGRVVDVDYRPLPGEPGAGLLVFLRDVTERAGRCQALAADLRTLAAGVGHDLGAPLRHARGFATILLEDYGDRLDDEGRRYAQIVVEAAEHGDRMAAAVVEYVRLAGWEGEAEAVELEEVVWAELDVCRDREPEARLEVAGPLPAVEGDWGLVGGVVRRLLANAAVHAAPEPEVRVRAETRDDLVRLWVEDDGPGIEPAQQERVFEPFARLDPSARRPGMGLAWVRRAVGVLGGRVWVEPAPGGGARFGVELRRART